MKNQEFFILKKESPESILNKFYVNFEKERSNFFLYKKGEKFSIYHHNSVSGLELAILKDCSEPHYHTSGAFFCFVDDAVLKLGGLDEKGKAHITSFNAIKGQVYPVPGYVLHAAGPVLGQKEASLLIYNIEGTIREREVDYPNDTWKPDNYHEL